MRRGAPMGAALGRDVLVATLPGGERWTPAMEGPLDDETPPAH